MVIGKSIVNSHIFKEALDVLIKEALHFAVVEVRVDEHRPNVGFENIWQTLITVNSRISSQRHFPTFGGCFTPVQ